MPRIPTYLPLLVMITLIGCDDTIRSLQAEFVGVAGQPLVLPCNTTLWSEDVVSLILWYKGATGAPIYSIDGRNLPLSVAKHSRSDDRLDMQVESHPPLLRIDPVRMDDEGEFRCRVDYRSARTQNYVTYLKVNARPHSVQLQLPKHPLLAGQTAEFACVTHGSKPAATLTWLKSGKKLLVPKEDMSSDGNVTTSHLTFVATVEDDGKTIACRAENPEIPYSALEDSQIIVVHSRPLSVKLQLPKRPLTAGTPAEFICMTHGSRPMATVTWWKSGKKLFSPKENTSSDGNVTMAKLTFIPTAEDDGKTIACRSENLNVPFSALEDSQRLDVHYLPQVSVNLGATIKRDNIKEGNDVFLDCNIKANPWISEITWTFEGQALRSNISDGLIISNQSLVLQKVKRHHRGLYRCHATNTAGESKSNPFFLRVKFVPICKLQQRIVYATGRNENVHVSCEVDADPRDVRFHWMVNSSSSSPQHIRTFTANMSRSVATYAPKNRYGYGTLQCQAENEVGKMLEPCSFTVIPAGPPKTVINCQLRNQSFSSLILICQPSNSGGLKELYFVEVYDTETHHLYANISEPDSPQFTVQNLPPDAKITLNVYAVNAMGRSPAQLIQASTLAMPQKQTNVHYRAEEIVTPLMAILVAIVSTTSILISAMICFCIRSRKVRQQPQPAAKEPKNGRSGADGKEATEGSQSNESYEERIAQNIHCTVLSEPNFYKNISEAGLSSYNHHHQHFPLTPTKTDQLPPDVAYAEMTLQSIPLLEHHHHHHQHSPREMPSPYEGSVCSCDQMSLHRHGPTTVNHKYKPAPMRVTGV